MKLLQINKVANSGSTGRIAEGIGETVIRHGGESYVAYGSFANPSSSHLIKIGGRIDRYLHALEARLFDADGKGSRWATKKLLKKIIEISPDIVQLHAMEGYFINYKLLFKFLKNNKIPVVWTLHDQWAITGHCQSFEGINCERWKKLCFNCPLKQDYPASWLFDRSRQNYLRKKDVFSNADLTVVPVANWLSEIVGESFLKELPRQTIYNGIDVEIFKPSEYLDLSQKLGVGNCKVVLAVAQWWNKDKGINDLIILRDLLPSNYKIIMVGNLNVHKKDCFINGLITLDATESVKELAELYSLADVFINPSYHECLPTTNIEAQSCGTPVITYRAGGAAETICDDVCVVIEKGDIEGMAAAIQKIEKNEAVSKRCRDFVMEYFRKEERYEDYYNLYTRILEKQNNQ